MPTRWLCPPADPRYNRREMHDEADHYEAQLDARAVRFGIVLVLVGLLAIAASVALWWVEFTDRPKLYIVGFVGGVIFIVEGARRIIRGRAPERDLLDPYGVPDEEDEGHRIDLDGPA